jgi:hypothetical protein
MPVRRIRVIVGTQVVTVELETCERLRYRKRAKQLMEQLNPMATKILAMELCAPHTPGHPPRPFRWPAAVRESLSIDHIRICDLEDTAPQAEPEIFSSCVSFIHGTFAEDLSPSPSRVIS